MLDSLISNVEEWSKERKLHIADPTKQVLKLVEEVGEVATSIAKNNRTGLIDGIGDVMVVLIILAMQNGLSLQDCLEYSYNEIKNRTGKTVDGIFIKD